VVLETAQQRLEPGPGLAGDRPDNGIFVRKIMVNIPDAHVARFADLGHAGGVEPVTDETAARGKKNLVALGGAVLVADGHSEL